MSIKRLLRLVATELAVNAASMELPSEYTSMQSLIAERREYESMVPAPFLELIREIQDLHLPYDKEAIAQLFTEAREWVKTEREELKRKRESADEDKKEEEEREEKEEGFQKVYIAHVAPITRDPVVTNSSYTFHNATVPSDGACGPNSVYCIYTNSSSVLAAGGVVMRNAGITTVLDHWDRYRAFMFLPSHLTSSSDEEQQTWYISRQSGHKEWVDIHVELRSMAHAHQIGLAVYNMTGPHAAWELVCDDSISTEQRKNIPWGVIWYNGAHFEPMYAEKKNREEREEGKIFLFSWTELNYIKRNCTNAALQWKRTGGTKPITKEQKGGDKGDESDDDDVRPKRSRIETLAAKMRRLEIMK